MYASWDKLVKARVGDAVRRSRTRGCPEAPSPLFIEARAMLDTQKKRCALCDVKLTRKKGDERVASLDRVYSGVKKSPTHEACSYIRNCRWVCFGCNHATRDCHMKGAEYRGVCK